MRTTSVLSIILFLALCALPGCEQSPVNGPAENAIVQGNHSLSPNTHNPPMGIAPDGGSTLLKKSTSTVIPVDIAFTDESYNIQSDRRGSYIDHVDGVSAYINHPVSDDLILNTNGYSTKGAVPRKLTFDLSHPVGAANPLVLRPSWLF